MEVGIIGLPFVGKTTVFNALTHEDVDVGTFSTAQAANRAVVRIPDPRLERLAQIFKPKRITPATIEYIDVAGFSKGSMEQGTMDAQLLADLRQVDALAHVVRVFEDDNVPHVDSTVNPARDIENLDLELILADLQIIDARLERLERELRTGKERDLLAQQELLKRCKGSLESEVPLRELAFSAEDEKRLRGYQFLTQKPLLIVLNIHEEQLAAQDRMAEVTVPKPGPQVRVVPLCAMLEMEIAQLDEADAADFLAEMGIEEPALTRFIHASYDLLDLQTFLTGGDREVHAWPLPRGATALDAAAEIHSDLARGFIRAEVIPFEDLDRCGSISRARETGVLRLEGKDYVVQDGDVITVRFNV